jgi:hypothetical protein
MPYKTILKIDGKEFEVLELNSVLEQKYDKKGRPSSGVKGGYFDVIMEGTADDTFASWITTPTKKKDGTFTLYKDDEDSKFKEIEFKSAYLTRLSESFVVDEDINFENRILHRFIDREQQIRELLFAFQSRTQMSYIMYCEITAEKIKIDGVEHDNKW